MRFEQLEERVERVGIRVDALEAENAAIRERVEALEAENATIKEGMSVLDVHLDAALADIKDRVGALERAEQQWTTEPISPSEDLLGRIDARGREQRVVAAEEREVEVVKDLLERVGKLEARGEELESRLQEYLPL